MTIFIRTTTSDDREAIIDLIWELNRFEYPLSADRAKDRADAARCLRDNDEAVRSTRGLSILAELDGVIAGYLCLAVESIGSFVREDLRRVAFVRELVVAERFRRAGIGQKLLQEAEDYAVSTGMKRLMLGVLARNAAAQNAYLKFGLRPYAIEMMKELD